MARKPTGRSVGRPIGRRQYPGDDRLAIEMARLILTGQAQNDTEASKRLAHLADGPNTLEASKARRLLRHHRRREQWFVMRAKASLAAGREQPQTRTRRGSLVGLLASMDAARQLVESQQQFLHMAKSLERSPLIEEAWRLERTQRTFNNLIGWPFE
jgi:hypothetical protein